MENIAGNVAIVTGGSRGIGFKIAKLFAEKGAKVIIANCNKERGEKAVKKLKNEGLDVYHMTCDISKVENSKVLARDTVKLFDKIDILINCAGVNVRKAAEDYCENDWDYMVNINLKGTFFTCVEVGKVMISQKKGVIVNIASIQSEQVLPERSIYAATKGGIRQLTKALAVEWAKYNIRVIEISTAFIMTDQTKNILEDPYWKDVIINRTPMRRFGTEKEVAEAVLFLVTSKSSYITGINMLVDGGWTAT
jgi:NAD(P)-dependent dehydrogenase (short-subunit alcohol dehydrogenase family)